MITTSTTAAARIETSEVIQFAAMVTYIGNLTLEIRKMKAYIYIDVMRMKAHITVSPSKRDRNGHQCFRHAIIFHSFISCG